MPFADELRLLFTLTLTGLVFASAYALARRLGAGGRLQAACDGLLLGYGIQYAAVALPGAAGRLNVGTMTLAAAAACAACWAVARAKRRRGGGAFVDAGRAAGGPRSVAVLFLRSVGRPGRLGCVAAGLFVAGYTAAHVYDLSSQPVLLTDPLVYHLPAAVQWMQTGRLGLFDTWYWNPAATYSPATTSTFMYWLMAPMHNDVLARYVQVVPLLLIFLVTARLARLLGCGMAVAGCVGVAAAVSRPIFSQVAGPKDDLIVTAFFACAVLSLAGDNPRDRLGPWRAAVAFGLVLASKYTILLVCPLFLFMIDAPLRAMRAKTSAPGTGRPPTPRLPPSAFGHAARNWALAVLVALALALPWYLRTWFVTGNPLFPVDVKVFGRTVFDGLFTTERDRQLRTAAGVWEMTSATYHSLPAVPLVALVLVFAAALVGGGRKMLGDPLRRAALVGVPVTIAIFLLASPHHEVRYVFPLLPLLYAAGGFAITRWVPGRPARVAVAAVFALVSVATSFKWQVPEIRERMQLYVAFAAFTAVAGAATAAGLSALARRSPAAVPKALVGLGAASTLSFLMTLYVAWPAYLKGYRLETDAFWTQTEWGRHGTGWAYVRNETPADSIIAFANTAYVYPLYGFDLSRKVVHAPVRPEIKTFLDVPRLGDTVPGDLILDAMTRVQNANADRATWLANLDRLGTQFVLIDKHDRSADPPELRFAKETPERFEAAFEDENSVVYRFRR